MRVLAKLAVVTAGALILSVGVSAADPSAQVSNGDIQKALESCPKHMVVGPDGVCVHAKSGRMGFDLAAPSDEGATAASAGGGATRSVGTPAAQRSVQVVVDLHLSFDVGSAALNDQDKANAKALAAMLLLPKYAPVRVQIAGYTDKTESAGLSKSRADSVKAYLVSQGVAANRLDTIGYGYTRLAKRVVIARRIE